MSRLLFALAALLPLACANRPDHRTHTRGDLALTFTNRSAHDLCALHIAPADAHRWGPSWLAAPVRAGEAVRFPVAPGRYMLRAHACRDAATVLVLYDIPVDAAHELVLHDPTAPEPTSPGRTAWPVTTWLAAADDWYTPRSVDHAAAHHVTLDSACPADLRLRIGPRELTTLPARARIRLAVPTGTQLALADPAHRDRASITTAGPAHLRIDAACDTIAAR